MNKEIKLLIADDHAIMRQGLCMMLAAEPGFEVIGEAADYEELCTAMAQREADCVISDYRMGEVVGLEGIEAMRKIDPEIPIVLLTGVDSGMVLDAALRAGVDAVVLKEGDGQDLLEALRAVSVGQCYVSESARSHMADVGEGSLTPRERQVLELLAAGKNNREIGELLFISAKTVDKHRSALLRKFNTHTTAELVAQALRTGLIG